MIHLISLRHRSADLAPGAARMTQPPFIPLKMRRQHPETELQISVAQFLLWALRGLDPPVVWSSTPTVASSPVTGARLKKMGYRKGWPDISLVYIQRAHFIELKDKKTGVVSPDQKACHEDLRAAGALVAVCVSVEEVEDALRVWGVPLRATTGAAA